MKALILTIILLLLNEKAFGKLIHLSKDSRNAVYLIRHAESNYNAARKQNAAKGIDLQDYKFHEDYIDTNITSEGFEQAKLTAELVKDINITYVVVSPLRRALITSREIFKNHKNKPKIVVWPILREILSSSCDLPDNLETIKQEFPEVDFSEMDKFQDKEAWILETFISDDLKSELQEELDQSSGANKNETIRRYILEKMKESWPMSYESGNDVIERTKIAKKMLEDKLKELNNHERLCIVGHSSFLRRFMATKFDENGAPIDNHIIKNAEVKLYEL
jgi:broad specificity phosphatase PhoE